LNTITFIPYNVPSQWLLVCCHLVNEFKHQIVYVMIVMMLVSE